MLGVSKKIVIIICHVTLSIWIIGKGYLVNYVINVQPVVVGDGCVVVLSTFVVEEGVIVVWDVELWKDFVAVLGVYVFVEDEYGAVKVDCVFCEVGKAVVVVEGSETRQLY